MMIEQDQLSAEEMVTIQAALKDKIGDFYFPSAIPKIFQRIWGGPPEEGICAVLSLEGPSETDDLTPDQETEISFEDLEEILYSARSSESLAEEDSPEFDLELHVSDAVFDDREPAWMIGLSDQFIRSVKKIDKKLKGRIFDALENICKDPMCVKGNTIKPLSDDLAGPWRYRVGDYRLIYRPDNATKRVTLLSFSTRGSTY